MHPDPRKLAAVLILAIVLNAVAVIAHAESHLSNGTFDCDMCPALSLPADAIAGESSVELPPISPPRDASAPLLRSSQRSDISSFPRGPPPSN